MVELFDRPDARRASFIRSRWTLELLSVVIAVLFAALICSVYFCTVSEPFAYPAYSLRTHIYPAVFFAAGHGFITTDVEAIPGLSEFIRGETDVFDLANIPPDLQGSPMSSQFTASHLYYIYAIGWMWRLFGVSTNTLILYAVLLRAISAGLAYGLFRFGLSRFGSMLGALILFSSPTMLCADISIRDFGRTPFLFVFFLITTYMVVRLRSGKSLLVLSASLGLTLGIGIGFRPDLVICLPPSIVAILFFTRLRHARPICWRLAALLLLLFFFSVASGPVFRASSSEGDQTTAHSFFLGLSPGLDNELQIGHASYDVMPLAYVADSPTYGVINTYARRKGNFESMVNPNSAEYQRFTGDRDAQLLMDPYLFYNGIVYAREGRNLMLHLVRLFPADMVTRAWRSVAAVFQAPKHYADAVIEAPDSHAAWLNALFKMHALFARHIRVFALVYIGVVILGLAAVRLRTALFAVGMLLWFGGYPSVQFAYRHSFYLFFMPVWALALCVEWPICRWHHGDWHIERRHISHILGNMLVLAGLVAGGYFAPIFGLRMWQSAQVVALAERLSSSTLEAAPTALDRIDDKVLIYPKKNLPGLATAATMPPGETAWEYMAVVFDTHGHDIPITVHFDKSRLLNDYTQSFTIYGIDDDDVGRVTFFYPVYEVNTTYSMEMLSDFLDFFPHMAEIIEDKRPIPEQDWWRRGRFMGISIPHDYLGAYVGFYIVRDIEDMEVLPILQAPENPERMRFWKTGPCERRLDEYRKTLHGAAESPPPDPINNACWRLDEHVLYHQPSKLLSRLLLSKRPGDDYVSEWRARVDKLPDLGTIAAFDLANAGTIWWNGGQVEYAVTAYRAACGFDASTPLYRVRLGQLLERLGDADGAMAHYMRALELQSLLPDTAERLDALFVALGDPAGHRMFWKRVFSLHPDCWFSGMRAGALFEDGELFADAAKIYGRVLQAHPNHPDTRLALARCWGRTGRYSEAVDLIMETAAATPGYSALAISHLDMLAEFLFGTGDHAAAEAVFSRLVETAPDNPNFWMRLGDTRVQNGSSEAGLAAYARALQLVKDSGNALHETIRKRIDTIEHRPSNPFQNRVE